MIVLDIDGVVSDTYEGVALSEISRYTPSSLEVKNSKPFEDAWYWINHYSSIYDIMFITERDKSLTNLTWEWFRVWDIPVDFIVFEKDATEFLAQVNPTVYVNDNAVVVSEAVKFGVNTFLVDRPYNEDSVDIGVSRIRSLWEIKCV
jgi:uncharacterized HAD superfamily protein